MLFVAALIASGTLMAIAVTAVEQRVASSAWLAPAVAALCYTTTFYFGRRYILPLGIAESSARSAITLLAMVVLTMAAALGAVWLMRLFAGRLVGGAALTLTVWFVLLWLAVHWHHRWRPA
jgi:hypothetical protein